LSCGLVVVVVMNEYVGELKTVDRRKEGRKEGKDKNKNKSKKERREKRKREMGFSGK